MSSTSLSVNKLSLVISQKLKKNQKIKVSAPQASWDLNLLFKENWSGLTATLRRIYGAGPPDPEDVAQEAFSALAAIDDPEKIINPKAFLYKVAFNSALKSRQTVQKNNELIEDNCELDAQSCGPIFNPAEIFENQRDLQQLNVSFTALNDKQKTIIIASRLHGLTYQQIAEKTGWSLADISRQLHKAMENLQASIEQ